ncbi:MAG: hypothetical protein RR595_04655 [Lysinibacillus sp.]
MLTLIGLLFICQCFLFITEDKKMIALTRLIITLIFLQILLKLPFINS